MNFVNANARVYVPDGAELSAALSRTTDLCICAHQDDAEIMAFCAVSACYERADPLVHGRDHEQRRGLAPRPADTRPIRMSR